MRGDFFHKKDAILRKDQIILLRNRFAKNFIAVSRLCLNILQGSIVEGKQQIETTGGRGRFGQVQI